MPIGPRVRLMHAYLQSVADEAGVDVLHVKGPALHTELLLHSARGRPEPRQSTDADVLVRPDHAQRYLDALRRHGSEQRSRFDTGSPFEHAANIWHPLLGHADVHRHYPGIGVRPGEAFAAWWSRRESIEIAHRACSVPALDDQRLLLLLHAARSQGANQGDVVRAWHQADALDQERVRDLAHELDATVALAAAIGELDQHREAPEYLLWKQFSSVEPHSRSAEWRARLRAARTPWQAASVLVRAMRLNTDRLALDLGRTPTADEVRRARRERRRRAFAELFGRERP
ncbi:nucleotidyltransferase family protein [Aestuariimicrobium soli]|uniref:nucleotidyltransferase family protein n=1 Tax=Aestuariimicrobium soli TaxID=2035834 RepID=UPI003EBCC6D6